MDITVADTFTDGQVCGLVELLATTEWAADRDREGVAAMLDGSDVVVGLVDGDDRLVAFARALTDGTYRAFVYDVVVAVVVGSLVGLVVPTLGGIPAIVSYLFVLGAGTLLGVTLLLREGPRAAGAVLAASGPVFLVTDKLLWDPLVAALGFDIAGLLSTWPLALGLLLLARASLHSHPVERPADGTPADTRPTDGGQS